MLTNHRTRRRPRERRAVGMSERVHREAAVRVGQARRGLRVSSARRTFRSCTAPLSAVPITKSSGDVRGRAKAPGDEQAPQRREDGNRSRSSFRLRRVHGAVRELERRTVSVSVSRFTSAHASARTSPRRRPANPASPSAARHRSDAAASIRLRPSRRPALRRAVRSAVGGPRRARDRPRASA